MLPVVAEGGGEGEINPLPLSASLESPLMLRTGSSEDQSDSPQGFQLPAGLNTPGGTGQFAFEGWFGDAPIDAPWRTAETPLSSCALYRPLSIRLIQRGRAASTSALHSGGRAMPRRGFCAVSCGSGTAFRATTPSPACSTRWTPEACSGRCCGLPRAGRLPCDLPPSRGRGDPPLRPTTTMPESPGRAVPKCRPGTSLRHGRSSHTSACGSARPGKAPRVRPRS